MNVDLDFFNSKIALRPPYGLQNEKRAITFWLEWAQAELRGSGLLPPKPVLAAIADLAIIVGPKTAECGSRDRARALTLGYLALACWQFERMVRVAIPLVRRRSRREGAALSESEVRQQAIVSLCSLDSTRFNLWCLYFDPQDLRAELRQAVKARWAARQNHQRRRPKPV